MRRRSIPQPCPIARRHAHRLATALTAGALLAGIAGGLPAAMTADERAAILAPTRDFSAPEQWESLSGGSATNRKRFDRDAFSQPSASMHFDKRADFFVGNGIFRRVWVQAPSSTRSADGLGPLYNARGCQRCHLKDGRGHPPAAPEASAVSMFLRLSITPQDEAQRKRLAEHRASVIPEPTYGRQLQEIAIAGQRPEGRMVIAYEDVPVELAGGEVVHLRKPRYSVADLGYGPLHPETLLSPRVASPMIGLGLLEAVAPEEILARADPHDADGDGISGRPNYVWSEEQQKVMLGRFGWKAGEARIADQAADAFSADVGLSSARAPDAWGDCTEREPQCRAGPHGDDDEGVEVSAEAMQKVVFYSSHLAVPERRNVGDSNVLRGKALFYGNGCIACHTPKHATRTDWPLASLAGQLIWPYTDLLLHDMGDGLSDGRPEGEASGREWRTSPLWGIGLTKTVNGHTNFLHDGRARTVLEAILWHGGEAHAAREAVRAMDPDDRQTLLDFLNSL